KFSTIDVTDAGLAALRTRSPILLTRGLPAGDAPRRSRRKSAVTESSNASAATPDDDLFEKLRALRRTFADERNVPAYIIFSDAALKQMASLQPTTEAE